MEGIIFASDPGTKDAIYLASTNAIDSDKVAAAFPGEDFNTNVTIDFRF